MRVYADGQNVANVIASGTSIKTDTGLKPSVRASVLTGLMSGKVSDPDTGASAAFKGVLVPALEIGGGFYLVKDNSAGSRSSGRAPCRSQSRTPVSAGVGPAYSRAFLSMLAAGNPRPVLLPAPGSG
jgi:hypothetical protein